MSKPLIAIPGRRSPEASGLRTAVVAGGRFYMDAIQRAGGLPVVIPPYDDVEAITATIDRCDGLLLLGGGDISPTSYGETEKAQLTGVDEYIDAFELIAIRYAIRKDIPVLAVCRGHQMLNVALGGTLIQHLSQYHDHLKVMHEVNVDPEAHIARAMGTTQPLVHSVHHQAIDVLAHDLLVVATSADGVIEAVQHKTASWIVGVQWHPEDTAHEDPSQQGLFDALVSQSQAR